MAVTNEELKAQLNTIDAKVVEGNTFVQQIYDANINMVSSTAKDVVLSNGSTVPNLTKRLAQFEDEKNLALGAIDATELARLSTEVALLGRATYSVYRPMSIGVAGMAGFGIGDIDVAIAGMTRRMMGNYVDATGSWMCFFPIAKMRIGHSASPKYATYGANTVEMADLTTAEKTAKLGLTYTSKTDLDLGDGWFIPPCFVDGGKILKGLWADKYKGGFENGILSSKKGLEPVHSATDARYGPRFSDILVAGVSAGTNRYDTAYNVVKSRGADYCVTPNQFYSYINLLVQCQAQNATSTLECAWIGVEPKQPKGNNNSLKDYNDTSVKYNQAASLNAGKSTTGAVVNFERTTHDGSILGICDINGGIYEIASGFTRTTVDGFLTIKKSVALKDLTSTTAFDVANFDPINIADVVAGNDGWIKFGNGANAVFENTVASDKTFNGIPLATGVTTNGLNQWGLDGVNRYLAHEMVPFRAGSWSGTSSAGTGYLGLHTVRSDGSTTVGVRAFKCQYV